MLLGQIGVVGVDAQGLVWFYLKASSVGLSQLTLPLRFAIDIRARDSVSGHGDKKAAKWQLLIGDCGKQRPTQFHSQRPHKASRCLPSTLKDSCSSWQQLQPQRQLRHCSRSFFNSAELRCEAAVICGYVIDLRNDFHPSPELNHSAFSQ